jgi:hypothetical protein
METMVTVILSGSFVMAAAFSTRDIVLSLFWCSSLAMEISITEFGFCYEIICVDVVEYPPLS